MSSEVSRVGIYAYSEEMELNICVHALARACVNGALACVCACVCACVRVENRIHEYLSLDSTYLEICKQGIVVV